MDDQKMKDIHYYAWRMTLDADIGPYTHDMWRDRPKGLEWEYQGAKGKYIDLVPDKTDDYVMVLLVGSNSKHTIVIVEENSQIKFDYKEDSDEFVMNIFPSCADDAVVRLPLRFKFNYTASVPVIPKCD